MSEGERFLRFEGKGFLVGLGPFHCNPTLSLQLHYFEFYEITHGQIILQSAILGVF